MEIYRHGDLLLLKIEKKPEGEFKKKKNKILLEGEATNHFHRIDRGVLYENASGASPENDFLLGYLELPKKGKLTHEEHKTIELEPGIYKYYRQREWDEQEERAVID